MLTKVNNDLRSQLSSEAKRKIKALSGPQPRQYLAQILIAWLVIAASIAVALWAHNLFITLAAIFIIATRQTQLGLALHEQAHYVGLKSKYSDWIVNAIAGFPLIIVSVENYAKVHLTHHEKYFSQEDPDFIRKSGENWTFPMRPAKLLLLVLQDLTLLSVIKFWKGKNVKMAPSVYRRKNPTPGWFKAFYFITVAVLLTVFHVWTVFLLYWLLPLLTVLQVLVRWGAICEHSYNVENASVEDTTPIIFLKWWEKLLMPNMNFSLHLYHHYFPGVSFSNLPAVHRIFQEEGLVNEAQIYNGYGSYLRSVLDLGAPKEAGFSLVGLNPFQSRIHHQ